jgi:hypothetical protein
MSAKLAKISNQPGSYVFKCPGCDYLHQIADKTYTGPGAKWEFNGSLESPTFKPSYLLWHPNPKSGKKENICHSFIENGKIRYLDDCFHHLKGKTVDLPDIDGEF